MTDFWCARRRSSSGSACDFNPRMHANPFSRASRDILPGPRRTESSRLHTTASGMSQRQPQLVDNAVRPNMEQKTYFNDPAQVEQWVASSATGPVLIQEGLSDSLCPDYGLMNEVPRACSSMQGPQLSIPLSFSDPSGLYDGSFDAKMAATNVYSTLPGNSGFSGDRVQFGDLAFDIPSSVDMMYTTSSNSIPYVGDCFNQDISMKQYGGQFSGGQVSQGTFSEPTVWSSPSTSSLETPLSSCSQGSLFPGHVGSPITFSASEDSNSNASLQDEGLLPASLIDYSVNATFPFGREDDTQYDMARFVGTLTFCIVLIFLRAAPSDLRMDFLGPL